jgi:hypothetical protein
MRKPARAGWWSPTSRIHATGLPASPAARVDGVMLAAEVARIVIEAMEAERFLILSHPQVHDYMQRKASNIDRWLTGMRRLRDKTYGVQRSS